MSDDRTTTACTIESGQITGAAMIVIEGELDLASAPQLVDAISALPEVGEPVVLDLSSVTFVDSSGVRALLDADRIANEKGRKLAIFRPGVAVTRLLDLVDLRSQFTELDSVDGDALQALRPV